MAEDYGIYVHTPWCRSRCPYCAFNVFVSDEADYHRWAEAILSGWRASSGPFSGNAHSLYFGGGTPSLAPPSVLGQIIDALPLAPNAEVTVEVNPGSIDTGGLEDLVSVGVNRLSMGVQTFEKSHAKTLSRGHTVAQARTLLSQASRLGFRSWSFDLMFALPGQTLIDLQADLDALMHYEPPHVSLYGLTIEPGTPFEQAQAQGRLSLPEASTWREMYDCIVDRLSSANIKRYEVSNFAVPGHRAIHNEHVWRGGHYAGLGPGAHGYLPSGARTISHADIRAWMDDPTPQVETPTSSEAAIDLILSTLRHIDGLPRSQLMDMSGFKVSEDVIKTLSEHGFITATQAYIQLTNEGFPVADGVVRELINALEPVNAT